MTMTEQNEPREKRQPLSMTARIVNRHKARTLCELEEAHCPRIYIDCVKRNLDYLRSDLESASEE